MELAEGAHFTNDVAGISRFYRQPLDTEPIAESPGVTIFAVGRTRILIHRTHIPAEGELPSANHIAFAVPGVDVACERLTQQGLAVEVPPNGYDWGRSACPRDSDGQLIELSQSAETPE